MGRSGVRSAGHGGYQAAASGGAIELKPEEEKDETDQMSLNKGKSGDKCTDAYNQCIGCFMWAMFGLVETVRVFPVAMLEVGSFEYWWTI